MPLFGYSPEIRKVVYTTHAIESLNYSLRKIIKGRGAFPHDLCPCAQTTRRMLLNFPSQLKFVCQHSQKINRILEADHIFRFGIGHP